MRFSLRSTLLLQVALPLLLIFAGLIYSGLTLLETVVERRLQQEIQLVARAIRLPVSSALETGDLAQVRTSLDAVFRIGRVYGAYLFDAEGRPISLRGSVEPEPAQAERLSRLAARGEREGGYESIEGRRVYSYFVPLFDRTGSPNGLLQVTRRASDFREEFREMQFWAWGLFAVVALLVIGALLLTHDRAIGRHVTALLSSMRAVERGQRRHRAELNGPSELRILAQGLNRMLDAIDGAARRLAGQRRERRILARRLREAETMAALGELAGGVAHELGAPLSVVDGRARRLARRLEDADSRTELEAIREQVQRMSATVHQLLAFGRERPGRMRVLSISTLVERATASEYLQGRLSVQAGPDAQLRGEPLRLEQAVANLLRNAVQAAAGARVEVGWSVRDSELSLWVDDAGPGIDPASRDRIFAPFYTSKRSGEGSGMGLAIVASVVRQHGGRVTVEDSPLGGARFLLVLPLLDESASGEES